MELKTVIVAGAATLFWHTAGWAQSAADDRLTGVERRIQYLEERVAAQDEAIVEKDRRIAELSEGQGGWFDAVEIGGLVELEGSYSNPYEGNDETDAAVATVELGVAAQVHDWAGGEVVLLHEEDDTPLEVDVAMVTVGPPDGPLSFVGGQYYLPFGTFETNLISDPLTLEVGETRETAVQLGFSSEGFSGSVYAFNGDNNRNGKDRIAGYGAAVGFSMEREEAGFGLNLSYINDIGDSDSLQGTLESNDIADRVPGWAVGVTLGLGGVSVIGEYLAALDDFDANDVPLGGAEPSSWMVEAAYDLDTGDRAVTLAVGYQGTDEALALELPETRFLVGLSIDVFEQVALAVEWARDEDYGRSDGGTGQNADTFTAQLAVEF